MESSPPAKPSHVRNQSN
jgi:hypothetical protein